MVTPKITLSTNDDDGGIEASLPSPSVRTEIHPCLQYLSSTTEHPFSVQHSETYGTTLVANKFIPPRSLLFRLPSEFLISYDCICATPLSKLILQLSSSDDNIRISVEELVWLNMIVWLTSSETNKFQPYFKALSVIPPNASSWPRDLQESLVGSNIYAVLDKSGANDDVAGNVSVVESLLSLLKRIRCVLVGNQGIYGDELAFGTLVSDESSIFTTTSISWARGHFLSRRLPELHVDKLLRKKDGEALSTILSCVSEIPKYHLAGYGETTSTFIPVLDLMNHSPKKENTCTVEMSSDGLYLEVRSGELALDKGDDLFYCYGEALSNEGLLHVYGFCLPDNPADTVSVNISKNDGSATSRTFSIGRGGAASVPSAMWRAIAGVDCEGNNNVEIGSGDLEMLLQYMKMKLSQLLTKEMPTKSRREGNIDDDDDDDLHKERMSFINIYKRGEREVLEELIRDLSLMIEAA